MPTTRSMSRGPRPVPGARTARGRVRRRHVWIRAVVEVEERGLGAFDSRWWPVASASWSSVTVSVTNGARRAPSAVNRRRSRRRRGRHPVGLDLPVLGDGSGQNVGGESPGRHVTGSPADPAGLVGVGRADALQRHADLVLAPHGLGDDVVGLVPREDEVGAAGHTQPLTQDAAGLRASISANSVGRSTTTPLAMTGTTWS